VTVDVNFSCVKTNKKTIQRPKNEERDIDGRITPSFFSAGERWAVFDRHRKGGHGFSAYNRRVRITEGSEIVWNNIVL